MKQPFIPQKIKDIKINLTELIPLISKSNQYLSNYNGSLKHLINPNILLSPMTIQESTMSSRIEGTQASLVEVLNYEAGESYDRLKTQEIKEIINYRKAMKTAVDLLNECPFIHINMIKEIHKVLLSGVRGSDKGCGEFRTIQNWIGKVGSKIDQASYIPPDPTYIKDAIYDWENFVNSDYSDVLIQLALIHAQFEIIHPFIDGNGRVGRILIPIFLYVKNYLFAPVFYLSEYFEKNREEYYLRLNSITENNDWQNWVVFFLNAIIEQSKINMDKTNKINALYDEMKHKIQKITKSHYSLSVLDCLFSKPVLNTSWFAQNIGILRQATANTILKKFVEAGILSVSKKASGNTPTIYKFDRLLSIADTED